VFKALNEQGYDTRQIVAFATELIGQVNEELAKERVVRERENGRKVRARRWPKRLGLRRTPPVAVLDPIELVG
jgi:hypothetical protein